MNEKYWGRWVWNKAMFVKDPETGKRTAVLRPKDDWVIDDRPDLAIVDNISGSGFKSIWPSSGPLTVRLESRSGRAGKRRNCTRPTCCPG